MRIATIERKTLSTPVMLAVIAHASNVIGGGVDVINPRAVERDIQERNSMYTYQTPGFTRSDSGDGPRRIARITALVNIMTIRVRTADHLGIWARGEWRETGVVR